ncbi:MAG: protein kinase domain-containing protein [Chthoniobacterales bacterium]
MSFSISGQTHHSEWSYPENEKIPQASTTPNPEDPFYPILNLRQSELNRLLPSIRVREESGVESSIKSIVEQRNSPAGVSEIKDHLATYATPSKEHVGTGGLKKFLSPREILKKDIEASKTDGEVKGLLAEEGGSLKLNLKGNISQVDAAGTITSECRECLDAFGIEVKGKIGEGAFGVVLDASIEGDNGEYVVKLEKEIIMKPLVEAEGLSFHERGDIAASCVKKLTNVTKPIFVIVALQKEENSEIEYHYLSVMEAESFSKEFACRYPKAKIGIVAQLMERVAGVELNDAIWGSSSVRAINFKPSGMHFKNVMNSLFVHLERAILSNYVHRDIKPENIIYNPKTGRVQLIDGGLAAFGRSKLQLKEYQGTALYMSPRVSVAEKNDKTYGPEVDAYSIAITLLHMIDPISFHSIRDSITRTNDNFTSALITHINDEDIESKYVEAYVKAAGIYADLPGVRNSKIFQELNKPENIFIRKLISLCFQVSAGGERGETAFQEWQTAFHSWQSENGFSKEIKLLSELDSE